MTSINKVILVGRVGQDLEPKLTDSGIVVNFSIATTERYKGAETTDWHNLIAWNGLAEICADLLIKGSLIAITGRLKNDNYEKDGKKFFFQKIYIDEMQLLSGGRVRRNRNENNLVSDHDQETAI